jgi:hypothetical protein
MSRLERLLLAYIQLVAEALVSLVLVVVLLSILDLSYPRYYRLCSATIAKISR